MSGIIYQQPTNPITKPAKARYLTPVTSAPPLGGPKQSKKQCLPTRKTVRSLPAFFSQTRVRTRFVWSLTPRSEEVLIVMAF